MVGLKSTTPLWIGLALCGCVSFSPQSDAITARFFSDPEVELDTPAFRKSSGFTQYAELTAFLAELADGSRVPVRVEALDAPSQEGRPIPIVFIGATSTASAPIRVWMQGGLHGDEPGSSEGLLVFLQRLLQGDGDRRLLERVELAVVPVANVDGYERQARPSSNGLDLNRDQTKLLAPESGTLKRAFNAFAPDVAVDFHEYRPYRRQFIHFGERGITHAYDVMFLYSGNLNVPEPLRALTREVFVAEAKAEVARHRLAHHDYITSDEQYGEIYFKQGSTNARSSATSWALTNTVSTLIEVRGVGIGRTSFKRRVMTTAWIADSYLRSAGRHAVRTREVLAQSRADRGPVVVKSRRARALATIEAIDVAKAEKIRLEVPMRDALRSEPRLVRARPYAYLLLPGQTEQVERLEVLGIEVGRLTRAQTIPVEALEVTKRRTTPFPYEGSTGQTVSTEVTSKAVEFPAGTFVVRMDQRRAPLAAEVLEPEMPNGLVAFGVLEVEVGQEVPVYRGMKAFSLN